MRHTRESILALLEKNDAAVRKGLRTVKSQCGFCFGGWEFGCSLISQMDRGSKLSDKQLAFARKLLADYAAVLAHVANENDRAHQEYEAEADDDRAALAAAERRAEVAFHAMHGDDINW